MGESLAKKLPSITTRFVDENGYIHRVWHRYLRLFSTETVTVPVGAGIIVYDGTDFLNRSITSANTKITVTNSNGVSGNVSLELIEANIDHDNLTNTHNLTTDINHNALTNYVANQHINWTSTASNFLTTGTLSAGATTLTGLTLGANVVSHALVFAGKENNAGGSATITITVTGVVSTDNVDATVEASTNTVSVGKVTPTANTITVLLSGDPGAATIVAYRVWRVI